MLIKHCCVSELCEGSGCTVLTIILGQVSKNFRAKLKWLYISVQWQGCPHVVWLFTFPNGSCVLRWLFSLAIGFYWNSRALKIGSNNSQNYQIISHLDNPLFIIPCRIMTSWIWFFRKHDYYTVEGLMWIFLIFLLFLSFFSTEAGLLNINASSSNRGELHIEEWDYCSALCLFCRPTG